jgi:hypothetical protein
MTKITKFAAIAVAALTLAVGSVATSSEAHAWGKKGFGWGPAIGLGIAAGVIGGAAYAASGPGYYVAPGYTSCRYVERFDAYGNYRGTRKICDVVGY